MPQVEQATIQDVAAKQRKKLKNLLDERAAMSYAFSYHKLMAMLDSFGVTPDEAQALVSDCILAADEKTQKEKKKEMDDEISGILMDNGLKGLREVDPAGRKVDCLWYESKNVRYDKNKMIEAAPSLGISTKKAIELVEAGRVETPFACLTLREVKEK